MGMLREIFGPSRDEVWQQLCDEIGAQFIKKGSWYGDSKVQIQVREWTITLDTYTVSTGKSSVTYTRMRAPYINRDGFRFTIYRKSFLSDLGKIFGVQDIEVGPPQFDNLGPLFGLPSTLDRTELNSGFSDFDRDYIIQGNNEEKVRLLFQRLKIRELIQAHPDFFMQVKGDEGWFHKQFPQGVDELYFKVTGVIKDVERLKKLYELYAELLNMLCHIGSAYHNDPKIVL